MDYPFSVPVIVAELDDLELCRFLTKIRADTKYYNADISDLVSDFNDLYRIVSIEESLRWQKHRNIQQLHFGLNQPKWQALVMRLVDALQPGLQSLDNERLAKMAQEEDMEAYTEMMVKTIPQDILKLYQAAWQFLGLAQMAHMGNPRSIPANCTLAHFNTFSERFNLIEKALLRNKMLARITYEDVDWMCRIAAHPMPEKQESEEETNNALNPANTSEIIRDSIENVPTEEQLPVAKSVA